MFLWRSGGSRSGSQLQAFATAVLAPSIICAQTTRFLLALVLTHTQKRRYMRRNSVTTSRYFFRSYDGIADFFRSEGGIFRGFQKTFGQFALISCRRYAGILSWDFHR